ncbi:MAG: UDP-N-acetylmuramoyl-L-alanyl-D-glutamate--2,6-diaminopimelate ligase [Pseudomonadota bacterium]
MKLKDLIDDPHAADIDIAGLATDSRVVTPGCLFAAISGTIVDGAAFVAQAVEKGAVAILSEAPLDCAVPVIRSTNVRRDLARASARFFKGRPQFIAGVTGTNGKTSTATMARQIWDNISAAIDTQKQIKAASMGTLGIQGADFHEPLQHTTPDPIRLHQGLQDLDRRGVTHLAMEVSSHGLAQHRADGIDFDAAAFTNITQDHLDYHPTFADYFEAKARLFRELLKPGGHVVINANGEGAQSLVTRLEVLISSGQLAPILTGKEGSDVELLHVQATPVGLTLDMIIAGARSQFDVPLIGAFQAENLCVAIGIALASRLSTPEILSSLPDITAAPGRMQLVGSRNGGAVFVDYAHTPDAVASALSSLRPHVEGRLTAIIGAGGDRDAGKRPLMGEAAATRADAVIITDDNPRTEDPAAIRLAVAAGAPGAEIIGDRGDAIEAGIAHLQPGDALLIAGKGHETGQIVGDEIIPFSDVEVAKALCDG